MEYRKLGSAGVRVSVIGLGTNRFGSEAVPQAQVNNIIDAALDVGINLIDTANMYQKGKSERTLGQALKGRWDRFVVATKFWYPVGEGPNDRGASRYHMMNAVEASLDRLQNDHIDLYYVHRWDEHTPIEETLRGLDDLIRAGKVRYLGASEFASWQLAHANLLTEVRGWTRFAALQSHYHMLERGVEREVLPYCRAHGVGFVPFFPLAGGFLTGKYKRGEPAPAGFAGREQQLRAGLHDRGQLWHHRKAGRLGPGTGAGAERTGRGLAAGRTGRLLGDLGGDEHRARVEQRQGGRLGADRRGSEGDPFDPRARVPRSHLKIKHD
jgi:aryl-alcohol dehydrogenase-like predicted oxidoreductase